MLFESKHGITPAPNCCSSNPVVPSYFSETLTTCINWMLNLILRFIVCRMASSLSEQQRLKIAENRQRALALRAARQQQQPSSAADCGRKNSLVNNCQSAVSTGSARSLTFSQTSAIPSSTGTNSAYTRTTSSQGISAKYSSAQAYSASTQSKPWQPTTLTDSSNRVPSATGKVTSVSSAPVPVKCCLVSRQKFAADARYCAPLVEVFKTIPSKQYGDEFDRTCFLFYCFVNSNSWSVYDFIACLLSE